MFGAAPAGQLGNNPLQEINSFKEERRKTKTLLRTGIQKYESIFNQRMHTCTCVHTHTDTD